MLFKRMPCVSVLLFFFSCADEHAPAPKEEWRLTEYRANTTSCCFAFDAEGDLADQEPSHPIFDALLGLDEGVHEIVLSLSQPHAFSIFRNSGAIMRGDMENDSHYLRLKYQGYRLELKIVNKTEDALILESVGYTCGITKVTMTFRKK